MAYSVSRHCSSCGAPIYLIPNLDKNKPLIELSVCECLQTYTAIDDGLGSFFKAWAEYQQEQEEVKEPTLRDLQDKIKFLETQIKELYEKVNNKKLLKD